MSNEKDALVEAVKKMQVVLEAAKKLKKEAEALKEAITKPERE